MISRGAEAAPDAAPGGTAARSRAPFWGGLAAIAGVGLAVRLWWVLRFKWDIPLWGDGWFYHWQARLLSEGEGFINPAYWYWGLQRAESADHPPVFTFLLTGLDFVGLRSIHEQLVAMCLLGALAVV